MPSQLIVWFVFFLTYGALLFLILRGLARLHVASHSASRRYGAGLQSLAVVAILTMGFIPLVFELLTRLYLKWPALGTFGWLMFVFAWVFSALPGVRESRRIYRAGGIDPDAQS